MQRQRLDQLARVRVPDIDTRPARLDGLLLLDKGDGDAAAVGCEGQLRYESWAFNAANLLACAAVVNADVLNSRIGAAGSAGNGRCEDFAVVAHGKNEY